MKTMTIPLALAVLAAGSALAQSHDSHHQAAPASAAPSASSVPAGPRTEGVVQKIDKGAGKITLKHGEIRNLDMPPMTMVFRVADAAILDRVKVGEKVRFAAEMAAGAITVTAIEAAE